MKVTRYLCCVLAFTCIIFLADCTAVQDRIDQQFLDALVADGSIKSKRPFCNAFTGCGRKRSFTGNQLVPQFEDSKNVRLPAPLYRALLRAASQEIQESMDRETNWPEISQDYSAFPPRKNTLHESYES
ncbi:uncharacterized protein LOC107271467 [Cephus cinctus]|uniref:Uncharacterized protein LOC107271467 n=1 Tax=Cephus cinctus TaxID=211228 RepID=A0AAJ7RPP8_CEPCN|nr:uncharacterized protein LOC107271467 [Cephus cinctus]XP_024944445.1 uncharacterized protein LOC107271467 [Cephus cinctus]